MSDFTEEQSGTLPGIVVPYTNLNGEITPQSNLSGEITPELNLSGTMVIPEIVDEGVRTWTQLQGKPFNQIDNNTLKVESNILKVNTTDNAEEDNTKPITSSGVHTIVGNIDALLSLI